MIKYQADGQTESANVGGHDVDQEQEETADFEDSKQSQNEE